MFLVFDQNKKNFYAWRLAFNKLKIKIDNFSEKMTPPVKPTTSGRESRALPEFTALTGNRSDGTSVPSKQRTIPSLFGKLDESPNQTITNTNTPKRKASEMDTSHSFSSLGDMSSTTGWNEDKKTWAEEVDIASMLDDSDQPDQGDKPTKNQKKKMRKRQREGKSNIADSKKSRQGPSWAEVAKLHTCLITSEDLNRDLDHKDFLNIQSQITLAFVDMPDDLADKCQIRKSGMRNGGIQLALEHAEGVNWYRKSVPLMKPVGEGPKYRFYGPGEKPFRCYKAFISETLVSKDKETVQIVLRKLNPILRKGFLAVTIVSASDDRIQIRIKVGEDLVEPLAKENNVVFYGMGTMTLTPLFGEQGRDVEEEMEIGGPQ